MLGLLDNVTVCIYYMLLSEDTDNRELGLYNWLNQEEKRRYNKISNVRKRKEFLISRIMLRKILSHYCHIDMNSITFSYNEYGKPYLRNLENPVFFNLSHAGQVVACAITKNFEIGIDVENINRSILNVAQIFFHENEIAYLKQLEGELQKKEACKIWTLKESYVKCKGVGLSMPLHCFNVIEECDLYTHTSLLIPDYCLSVMVECEENLRFYKHELDVSFLTK